MSENEPFLIKILWEICETKAFSSIEFDLMPEYQNTPVRVISEKNGTMEHTVMLMMFAGQCILSIG